MKNKLGNALVYAGAAISILLIAYCAVYIFNYYSANSILWQVPKTCTVVGGDPRRLAPNEIGDSIGGILNPIVGLTASVLTFLAFYMQKRANDEIQGQFKVQQFESQFYEMLRLHKENVNEMTIRKIDSGEAFSQRAAFEVMAYNFNLLLKDAKFGDGLTEEAYGTCYNIFFWGYTKEEGDKLSQSYMNRNDVNRSKSALDMQDYVGYSGSLGHYFRHLFMMVKFVVYSDVVTEYNEKLKYLKMLRAQLSNHEQIMLFYNWLSGYGAKWENDHNRFFTEYLMIHNLWKGELSQDSYILNKVVELENKPVVMRTGKLFEYQETIGIDAN